MKKLFSFFCVLSLICLVNNSMAQISAYTFSQTNPAYSEITGTLFDSATSASGVTSLDDQVYLARPIGFSFTFNGISYSTYNMNTNGQVTFGATSPGTTNYSPISSTTAYAGAIAGLARDLQGIYGFTATRTLSSTQLTGVTEFSGIVVGKLIIGTGIAAGTRVTAINTGAGTVDISIAATAAGTTTLNCASGELRSETQGAAGSRVHIIQWKNFKRFGSATLTDDMDFQIRLYETTNKVEIHYGTVLANATAIVPQVGLRGATNADFNNRSTATDWTATIAGGTNTASCTLSSTIFPPSGLKFTYTPPVILNDVGVTVNLAPTGSIITGSPAINPSVKVKNFGTNNQLVPFRVVYKITGPATYADSTLDTVSAGLENTVVFPSTFSPVIIGVYNVTAYTRLTGDQNLLNDTLKTSFTVTGQPNYGNDSGYFYANTLATNQPSFPKFGWKDTVGSRSILVNGVTSPGNTLVGSTDDGYFKLGLKTLLLALGQDTTNRHIKYNGVCYDSIFPGTNGIVGLTEQYGAVSLSTFTIDGLNVAKNALLPLWHDFNLATLTSQLTNRVSAKVVGDQLIITYDRVASFAPTTDWASFQVVVELVTGCGSANSNFRYTYADTTTNQTSGSFVTNFLASYNATPGSVTTFRNHVVGYSMNGGPIPYSAFCSPANTFAGPNALYVPRTIYNTTTKRGLAVEFGPVQNSLNEHDGVTLTLSLNLEGLYNNPDGARVRDTVQLILRDGFAAPNSIYLKQNIYLDSAFSGGSPFGTKTIDLPNLKKNYPYYFQVKHRNSVSTWSLIDSTNTGTMTYNFTTGIAKAFASNQVIVGTKAAFYTGDITQDGCVDVSDLVQVYNDAANFEGGDYLITDLNWDGIADVSDILLGYNNLSNFICEQAPPGALRPANTKNVTVTDNSPAIILPDYNVMTKEEYLRQQNAVEQGDIKIDSK